MATHPHISGARSLPNLSTDPTLDATRTAAALMGVDSVTLAYLQLVSRKTGAAAIEAWIGYTGWIGDDNDPRFENRPKFRSQKHLDERLAKARHLAHRLAHHNHTREFRAQLLACGVNPAEVAL